MVISFSPASTKDPSRSLFKEAIVPLILDDTGLGLRSLFISYRVVPGIWSHSPLGESTSSPSFTVKEGDEVDSPSGEWLHIPGTTLYEINRERNPKPVSSKINGTIASLNSDLDGSFVEAGEKLMTIRHPLKKKEIIEGILKEVLYLFPAP